jgi:hypothetical protein
MFSFAKRLCTGFVLLGLFALCFSGCAVTSSGNTLGEAAVLKYSSDQKKFRYVDVGGVFAGDEKREVSSPHHSKSIMGLAVNTKIELLSLDYSLAGQKGGLFLSVPISIPMDIGLRPSLVQWFGPAYLGAGVSFVGGYYSNDQKENYEPKVNNPKGRFDGFILYNVGGGAMFDLGEVFSLGAYVNYERMAFNSGGSTAKNDMFSDWTSDKGRENYPGYAHRTNVLTFGISTFWKKKHPWGLYFEYSPEVLPLNDECGKFQIGWVFLY